MILTPPTPQRPTPQDPAELARVQHQALRHRILGGEWSQPGQDLHLRVSAAVGAERSEAWRATIDGSANVARMLLEEVSTLFELPPLTWHADARSAPYLDWLDSSGRWAGMQTFQRDTLGLRDGWLKVGVANGRLTWRRVAPHLIDASGSDGDPGVAAHVEEWRVSGGRWRKDVYDIRGSSPHFRIEEEGGSVLAQLDGDKYPWRKADGTPILGGYVLAHADPLSAQVYTPYSHTELFDLSLNLGVLWSMFTHAVVNASWPQRYLIGAEPAGMIPRAGGGVVEVVADPAVVLFLRALDGHPGAPIAGQWAPGIDPDKLQTAIAAYETRGAALLGIGAADLVRATDPRSGAALSVSAEAKRAQARRYAPVFRPVVQEILSVGATMTRIERLSAVVPPEDGYEVEFAGAPPSAAERESALRADEAELRLGLASPVDLYMRRHPAASREQAHAELGRIAAERRQYST